MNSLFLYLIVPFSFVRNSSFVKCYLTGGIITINENFIDNFSKVKFYCKSAQVIACFWIFTIKKCTLDGHFRYLFPSFALFNCLIIQSTWFPLLHAYVTQIRELLNKVEHISTFFHTEILSLITSLRSRSFKKAGEITFLVISIFKIYSTFIENRHYLMCKINAFFLLYYAVPSLLYVVFYLIMCSFQGVIPLYYLVLSSYHSVMP